MTDNTYHTNLPSDVGVFPEPQLSSIPCFWCRLQLHVQSTYWPIWTWACLTYCFLFLIHSLLSPDTVQLNSAALLSGLNSSSSLWHSSAHYQYRLSASFGNLMHSTVASRTDTHSTNHKYAYRHRDIFIVNVYCMTWELVLVIKIGIKELTFTSARLPR